MLREILRDNLDALLLTIEKIGRAFDIVRGEYVSKDDLLEIKRLIHSLKGNLQSIGLDDEAELAIALEDKVFKFIDSAQNDEVMVPKSLTDEWFIKLNEVEFSLKSYMF